MTEGERVDSWRLRVEGRLIRLETLMVVTLAVSGLGALATLFGGV